MKILVTGGAGFIGSHVCDALLARGDAVVCVDDFNAYYDPSVKKKNIAAHRLNPLFTLYGVSILDFAALQNIFQKEKPDKIVHLAARAGVLPSLNDPHLYQDVNVKGTLNLLELAREFKVANFVYGSSSSVYGNRLQGPFSEEDKVDAPISPYAATKKAAELWCHTYSHLYNIPVTCLRFFTVYGPRGRPDMMPLMFTRKIDAGEEIQIWGDGSSQRDYTFVLDIVAGVLSALDKNFRHEVFNLGGSNPVRLSYFITLLEQELGKKAKRLYLDKKAGDVEITFADLRKSERLLGYVPRTSVEQGVRELVRWYLQQKGGQDT